MLCRLVFAVGFTFALSGCIHPRIKFRKAKLLNPIMDPAKTHPAIGFLKQEQSSWHELSDSAMGSSMGSSCPTCGG